MAAQESARLIVAITGATGVVYGVELLKLLRDTRIETHLVMSAWAARTLLHETDYTKEDVSRLASKVYSVNDMGAAISSGSFLTCGIITILYQDGRWWSSGTSVYLAARAELMYSARIVTIFSFG